MNTTSPILENLQNNLRSIFLKNKKKQKELIDVEVIELDITQYPWLKDGIRRLKIIPLILKYRDGTSETGIATRYDNDDFTNGLEAIDICERNNFNTFPVLGAINSTDEYKFIITQFVENVTPFSEYPIDNIRVFIEMLTRGLDSLRNLHAIGITHGDFEPRNIGIDSSGQIYIFDFEGAQIYSPQIPPKSARDQDILQFKKKLIIQALKSDKFTREELDDVVNDYE